LLFHILTPHFTPVAAVVVDFSRFWWENKTATTKEEKKKKKNCHFIQRPWAIA
jgi:hypothetical protein